MAGLFFVLKGLLVWVLSSFVLKLFATMGIAVFTYKSLDYLLIQIFDQMDVVLGVMPHSVVQIMALAGFHQGLTIISSALLTAVTIRSLKAWVGVL